MVLGKGAFAIHQSGKWYTGRSIKSCLVTSNVRTLLITMCTWILPAELCPSGGTDKSLMPREVLLGKFHAQSLDLFRSQSVIITVFWSEVDDIMMSFNFWTFLIFSIAKIQIFTLTSEWSWIAIDALDYEWTVAEINVPEGFKSTVSQDGNNWTIVNDDIPGSSKPTDPSDPTDPSKPIDPSDPTDPSKPIDPSNPVAPEVPGTDKPGMPKTGDNSALVVWIAILVASGVGCAGVIVYERKKKYRK